MNIYGGYSYTRMFICLSAQLYVDIHDFLAHICYFLFGHTANCKLYFIYFLAFFALTMDCFVESQRKAVAN